MVTGETVEMVDQSFPGMVYTRTMSELEDVSEAFRQWEPFTEPTRFVIKRHKKRLRKDSQDRWRFDHGGWESWVEEVLRDSMQHGFIIAMMRQSQSRILNVKDKLTGIMLSPEKKHSTEVESCCSEIAVAQWMGIEWGAVVNKFKKGGDVGNWTQVRNSFRPNPGLHLRESDLKSRNKPYVSVTGCMGVYLIHGWEWGFKALQRETIYDDHPAHVVPYAQLRSMRDIPPEPPEEVGADVTDAELKKIMGWTEEEFQAIKDE